VTSAKRLAVLATVVAISVVAAATQYASADPPPGRGWRKVPTTTTTTAPATTTTTAATSAPATTATPAPAPATTLTPTATSAPVTATVVPTATATTAVSSNTVPVPVAISSDCAIDVTSSIRSWVASVPDGSTLSFGPGRCYRIEGVLEFRNRKGLTFEGNGSTFRSLNPPQDQRAIWRVIDSDAMTFRNMTIDGSYGSGGTFNAALQHAHAIDLRGTGAEVANVVMTDVAGDCVYFGLGYSSALRRSSGTVHDSSCSRTGRHGVAVTAGNDIRVERVTTNAIGYITFDVEPNVGVGFGSQRVSFINNTIGSYRYDAYAIIEYAPITDQVFSNNRIVADKGLRIGVVARTNGVRARNVTISGNSSVNATWPVAMDFQDVDGLTVTGNTAPLWEGTFAAVHTSCTVNVSGNSYPGGTSEVTITNTPSSC
jgi:hypothetical protein